jgi:hypothetical protein
VPSRPGVTCGEELLLAGWLAQLVGELQCRGASCSLHHWRRRAADRTQDVLAHLDQGPGTAGRHTAPGDAQGRILCIRHVRDEREVHG